MGGKVEFGGKGRLRVDHGAHGGGNVTNPVGHFDVPQRTLQRHGAAVRHGKKRWALPQQVVFVHVVFAWRLKLDIGPNGDLAMKGVAGAHVVTDNNRSMHQEHGEMLSIRQTAMSSHPCLLHGIQGKAVGSQDDADGVVYFGEGSGRLGYETFQQFKGVVLGCHDRRS